MKKLSISIILVLVLVLSIVGVVSAITDGELDGEGHPYVGLMVAKDADGLPLWRCSGTLISPTLFLTAGHCTEAPAASATVWFETDIQNYIEELGYPNGGDTSIDGAVYIHPQFDPEAFYLYDLGIVVLDEPAAITEFGALPQLDQLDALKPKRDSTFAGFTAVGYGLQASFPDGAAWKTVSDKIRMVAYPVLLNINAPGMTGDFSMLLSNNHATGGTCYGDSGGPNFLRDTNIIAGVTSFGMNVSCAGTGGVYRIDRADDLDWINLFLSGELP
jgi:secreted trypsin-like serine protease